MPIQGILVGRDATAYWSSTEWPGTQAGAQAWVDGAQIANNIMDLTGQIGSEQADSTTRAEAKAGWTAEISVLKNGQYQFDFRWEPADAFTAALITAWDTGAGISMLFLDQPGATGDGANNAQGLGAVWSVSISKQENLRDIQKGTATVTVAKSPLWATGLGA